MEDSTDCLEFECGGRNLLELEDLSEHKYLKILDASCNNITRISGIAENKKLSVLKLYENNIEAIEGLDRLSELSILLLHDNALTTIGRGLMHCHKIQTLRLDRNRISGVFSGVELASCAAHLLELDLSYNKLIGVEAVAALPNLVELHLAGNKLQLVPEVARCVKLNTLSLSSNPLQKNSLSNLSGSKIKILHLSAIQLDSLSHFPQLPLLQDLHITHNNLSSLESCHALFPALELLDIRWNKLEVVDSLFPLAALGSLTELLIDGNKLCSQQEMVHAYIREVLPSIELVDSRIIQDKLSSLKAENIMATTSPELSDVAQALLESDHLLEDYQNQITTSFRMLQGKERENEMQSLPRLPSRSSNRARLEEALEYANTPS